MAIKNIYFIGKNIPFTDSSGMCFINSSGDFTISESSIAGKNGEPLPDPDLFLIELIDIAESFNQIKKIRNSNYLKTVPIIAYLENYSRIIEMKCEINAVRFDTAENISEQTLIDEMKNSTKKVCYETVSPELESYLLKENHNSIPLIQNKIFELLLNSKNIEKTVKEYYMLLKILCKLEIIILLVNKKKISTAYIEISENVDERIFDDFFKFCLHDHFSVFPNMNPDAIEKTFLHENSPDSMKNIIHDRKLMSSYYYTSIVNNDNEVIATLHFGNFYNNYFSSGTLSEIIYDTARKFGFVLNKILLSDAVVNEKKDIRNLFSKFVPLELIDEMINEDSKRKKNERKEVAILFSDIRSFTSITENNNADSVITFLNEYFEEMVKCIKESGGIIDKFIGDAIVAVFGLYGGEENIAEKAVIAAMNMSEKLKDIHPKDILLPPGGFNTGIGIHFGETIVGNVGCDAKMAYTTIGEISSIAEECEGLTKKYGTSILFTDTVNNRLTSSAIITKKIESTEETLHYELYTIETGINKPV